jgi:hypothetical protein
LLRYVAKSAEICARQSLKPARVFEKAHANKATIKESLAVEMQAVEAVSPAFVKSLLRTIPWQAKAPCVLH